MSDKKLCSCGGNMRDLGKKFINISDTHYILSNHPGNFEAVQMYICESCNKLEFYSLERQAAPEPESYEKKIYDTYKDTATAKLEKMLEKDSYTAECKAVIRRILAERN